jgi:DNA-binding NtrC family response regulator
MGRDAGAMRVLVVEDDCLVRETVCEILGNSSIETACEADAEVACRLLSTAHWDLVLSDLLFPGRTTGLDLAIHAAEYGVRCVIMSGAPDLGPLVEGKGFPFLAKPFTGNDLLAAVGGKAVRQLAAWPLPALQGGHMFRGCPVSPR